MNIKLNYKEAGKGFPLILLHGNGESLEIFGSQMEYFAKDYRVIALDTRGHGKSPRGEEPFTIEQFAEDLLGFMDQMKIQKANILGFSDGANIALAFALKHQDRINKLILNGGNLDPKGVKSYFQMPIEIGYAIARRGKSLKARANAEMLDLMVNQPKVMLEELKAVTVPTLVMAGTRDMIKTSHTRAIANALPHAKLVFIRGSHSIVKTKQDQYNQAVASFLKEDHSNIIL